MDFSATGGGWYRGTEVQRCDGGFHCATRMLLGEITQPARSAALLEACLQTCPGSKCISFEPDYEPLRQCCAHPVGPYCGIMREALKVHWSTSVL